MVLLGDISGTRDGQEWPPRGSEVDLPDDEGLRLCAIGMARPVRDDPVERAVADAADVETRPLTTSNGPVRRRATQG